MRARRFHLLQRPAFSRVNFSENLDVRQNFIRTVRQLDGLKKMFEKYFELKPIEGKSKIVHACMELG